MPENSELEREVLDWIAHDFEAPQTITTDISRDLKRAVSESEVRQALLALTRKNQAQAYSYDSSAQQYRKISSSEAETSTDVWFKARMS